jgi:hypothetical protein
MHLPTTPDHESKGGDGGRTRDFDRGSNDTGEIVTASIQTQSDLDVSKVDPTTRIHLGARFVASQSTRGWQWGLGPISTVANGSLIVWSCTQNSIEHGRAPVYERTA